MATEREKYVQDAEGQWWWIFKDGRRTRVSKRTCPQCGKTFVAYRERTCCSHACAGLRRRVPPKPPRTCPQCKQEFRPSGGGQQFCSHGCAATFMHAHRTRTTAAEDTGLVNENNPRFSHDADGQWWYQSPKGRTRARILVCAYCRRRALKSMFHRTRYCSTRCSSLLAYEQGRTHLRGEKSPHWTGGLIKRNGYVIEHAPDHPSIKGTNRTYMLQHRLVMERELGRLLMPFERVHHVNGNRSDNRPENLELWAHSHPPGQRVSDLKNVKHCQTCTCEQTESH